MGFWPFIALVTAVMSSPLVFIHCCHHPLLSLAVSSPRICSGPLLWQLGGAVTSEHWGGKHTVYVCESMMGSLSTTLSPPDNHHYTSPHLSYSTSDLCWLLTSVFAFTLTHDCEYKFTLLKLMTAVLNKWSGPAQDFLRLEAAPASPSSHHHHHNHQTYSLI